MSICFFLLQMKTTNHFFDLLDLSMSTEKILVSVSLILCLTLLINTNAIDLSQINPITVSERKTVNFFSRLSFTIFFSFILSISNWINKENKDISTMLFIRWANDVFYQHDEKCHKFSMVKTVLMNFIQIRNVTS